MIEQIFIAFITSSMVSAIFIFFIKTYIQKWLDYEFNKRHAEIEIQKETAKKTEALLSENLLGVYPQLIEIAYRIRKAMDVAISSDSAVDWIGLIRQPAMQLTEDLFRYRFFLPDAIFDHLHELKHISQDAVLLADTFTRDENLNAKQLYIEAIERFRPKYERAVELFDLIKSGIDSRLTEMRHIK